MCIDSWYKRKPSVGFINFINSRFQGSGFVHLHLCKIGGQKCFHHSVSVCICVLACMSVLAFATYTPFYKQNEENVGKGGHFGWSSQL